MAQILSSPAVQTNEIDYSDYVASAANSILGIVGGARRGPTTATLITTQEDFIKVFGRPSPSDYGAHSALLALNHANQLYYKRVCHRATTASAGNPKTDKLVFSTIKAGSIYNDLKLDITANSEDDVLVVLSKLDRANSTPDTYTELERFEQCSLNTADVDNFINNKINGVSNYIVVSTLEGGEIPSVMYFSGGTEGASKGTAGNENSVFRISTKTYDSTMNYAVVKFSEVDSLGYFNMQILSENRSHVYETINNLSMDTNDERYLVPIINGASAYINIEHNLEATDEPPASPEYVIRGGDDGIAGLTIDDIVGNEGLGAFSNPEVYDINLLAVPGWYQAEVTKAGLNLCQNRGDCLYIAETPRGLSPQQANDWANGTGEFLSDHTAFDSSYGALYYPWIRVFDQYSNQKIWLPPSGAVLGQIAYSDTVGQPWFAPAGLNRGIMTNVLEVEHSATKGERDALYGNRNIVNPIINYKGQGIVIWGQKTMQRKPTATDRVNTRRLMNYLKRIIAGSTAFYLFEPNDEYNWVKWIDMVEPRLANVLELRGIYDYVVEMRPTTAEIEDNIMPGRIKVKPTKTAEFIPLDFMIAPYGAVFDSEINS